MARKETKVAFGAHAAARAGLATVRFAWGLGVVVPGGFVLTAAECLPPGSLPHLHSAYLDEHFVEEEIIVRGDKRLTLRLVALELMSDVAVFAPLAAIPLHGGTERAEEFRAWYERVTPVPVSRRQRYRHRTAFPVRALSSGGAWVQGTAVFCQPWLRSDDHEGLGRLGGDLHLTLDAPLPTDFAGGPVIDQYGELVTVSPLTDGASPYNESRPYLRRALPTWVWDVMTCAPLAERDVAARRREAAAWMAAPAGAVAELLARHAGDAHQLRGCWPIRTPRQRGVRSRTSARKSASRRIWPNPSGNRCGSSGCGTLPDARPCLALSR